MIHHPNKSLEQFHDFDIYWSPKRCNIVLWFHKTQVLLIVLLVKQNNEYNREWWHHCFVWHLFGNQNQISNRLVKLNWHKAHKFQHQEYWSCVNYDLEYTYKTSHTTNQEYSYEYTCKTSMNILVKLHTLQTKNTDHVKVMNLDILVKLHILQTKNIAMNILVKLQWIYLWKFTHYKPRILIWIYL